MIPHLDNPRPLPLRLPSRTPHLLLPLHRHQPLFLTRGILTRIDLLVVHELDPAIERACRESTHQRTQPVDPVVVREVAGHDGGAEAAGRVKGSASEVHA
jgi:hypothetical protein